MKLYDPKLNNEVQEFVADSAKDLVTILASIVAARPGCMARATGIRFEHGLVVHSNRGVHIANIVTKWVGE